MKSAVSFDAPLCPRALSCSKSNLELFRAEASSEEWKAYVEYIDDMIIDGFFSSIECSLKFFLDNTGGMLHRNSGGHVELFSGVLLLISSSSCASPTQQHVRRIINQPLSN